MHAFLRRFFSVLSFLDQLGLQGANRLKIIGFWCDTTIRLPQKLKTPGGSRVFVISVCLDVHYWIEDGHLIIHKAKLCQNGDNNVIASNTGEAMRARQITPNSLLIEVVQRDWEKKDSQLSRIMLAKWYDANRDVSTKSVVNALNSKASAEDIEELVRSSVGDLVIQFDYTKANGESSERSVTVKSFTGNSLYALDHGDGVVKSFRVDRITNVRKS